MRRDILQGEALQPGVGPRRCIGKGVRERLLRSNGFHDRPGASEAAQELVQPHGLRQRGNVGKVVGSTFPPAQRGLRGLGAGE
eukprot:6810139-Alexandrium_andersonii.AAC.1